jgi:zinc transporter, ZIP family
VGLARGRGLMDGIPESIANRGEPPPGGAVGWVTVIAVFLSNIPEGWSSSAGMKKAGRRAAYVFGTWIGFALVSGLASVIGAVAFAGLPAGVISATVAVAAGAILAMLADTMMPEAFEAAHDLVGFVTVLGFLAAFALSKLA